MSSQSVKSSAGLNKTSFANKRRKRNEAAVSSVTTITSNNERNASDTSNKYKNIEVVANDKRNSLVGFDESFDLFVYQKGVDHLKLQEEKKNEDECETVNLVRSWNKDEGDKKWSSWLNWNVCPVCYEETDDWNHVKDCLMEHTLYGASVEALLSAHHQYISCRLSLGLPLPTKLYDSVFKNHLTSGNGNGKLVSPGKPAVAFGSTLKWKGNSKKGKYILLRRSQEERENILSQKLAIILMDIAGQTEHSPMTPSSVPENSAHIKSIRKMESPLWMMAQAVNNCKFEDLYTSAFSPFVQEPSKSPQPLLVKDSNSEDNVSRENNVSPVKVCSFIDGSSLLSDFQETTSTEVLEMDTEENNHSYFSEAMKTSRKSCDLDGGTGCHRLENDWAALFASSQLSDICLTCDQTVIPAHSLVLYVRCPTFYDFVASNSSVVNGHLNFKWEVCDVVGKAFLKFLYSGKDDVTGLTEEELRSLKEVCSMFLVERLRCQVDAALRCTQAVPLVDVHPVNNCPANLCSISPSSTNTGFLSMVNSHKPPHLLDDSVFGCVNSSKAPSSVTEQLENEEKSEDLTAGGENDRDSVDGVSLCSVTTEEMERDKSDGWPGACSEGYFQLNPSADSASPFVEAHLVWPSSPSQPTVKGILSASHRRLSSPLHPGLDFSTTDNHPIDHPVITSPSISSTLSPPEYLATTPTECDTSPTDPPSKPSPMSWTSRSSLTNHFKDDIFLSDGCLLDTIEGEEGTSGRKEAPPLCTPSCQGNRSTLVTPTAQVLVSDNVTPMPNYTSLISPHLKAELKRYGLKQDMEKGKAKLLLRYIYDQIHPMVPTKSLINSREAEENHVETDTCLQSMNEDIILSSCSSDSENSETKESECYSLDGDDTIAHDDTNLFQTGPDLLTAVSSLIKENAELYESILRYTPVWVEKLQKTLKESNVKCKMTDLMDVLDQLCVTFRAKKKDRSRIKRRK